MTKLDDEVVVVQLACETRDRDKREHAALLRVAKRIDKQASRRVVTNTHPRDLGLAQLVEETRG